ncbi:hypothetical protein K8R30_03825 [archaeon]|nr:hypothetical protein [archaeon]
MEKKSSDPRTMGRGIKAVIGTESDAVLGIMKKRGINNSHGWDVCPNANEGCLIARNGEIFHEICSVDYRNCEIKYFQDRGGSQ